MLESDILYYFYDSTSKLRLTLRNNSEGHPKIVVSEDKSMNKWLVTKIDSAGHYTFQNEALTGNVLSTKGYNVAPNPEETPKPDHQKWLLESNGKADEFIISQIVDGKRKYLCSPLVVDDVEATHDKSKVNGITWKLAKV